MRIKTSTLFGGLLLASLLGACGSQPATLADAPQVSSQETNNKRGNSVINMGGVANVQKFALSEKMDVSKLQAILVQKRQVATQSEDAAAIVSIFNSLLAAENSTAKLNLQFSMSDAPVEDGIFLFKVDSDSKQELKFEMFDEEGYQLAAQNKLELDKGANYKALNVRDMPNGSYLLRIQDNTGATMMQKVTIQGK